MFPAHCWLASLLKTPLPLHQTPGTALPSAQPPDQVPIDPLLILPPDDTGADTFRRFRYQARLTVPYCLECILGRARCVVPEHIEDVAVQYDWGWLFLQIKTRDPGLGPWRLRDVLPPRSGLASLLRAFRATDGVEVRLELQLEGSVRRNDLIEELLQPNAPRSPELRAEVARGLGIDEPECAVFLDRLRVRTMPLRDSIKEMNVAALGELEPTLTLATIKAIEDQLVQTISDSMALERLGEAWPQCVILPGETELPPRVAAKRLTPERLDRFRKFFVPSLRRPILRSDAGTEHEPSQLVRKLRDGGADDHLIQLAKTLRSNAVRHEIEGMSKDLFGDEGRMEDLRTRLLVYTSSLPAIHSETPNPAPRIFQAATAAIQSNVESIDPYWIFGRDTPALLGELCELSDQCLMRWS